MEDHHSPPGDARRPQIDPLPRQVEWVVTPSPVPDADSRHGSARGERIAELHRQVRDGVYDNLSTIDTVARRILRSGDL